MGNYELLKAAINEVIKANGIQEITGEVLNQVLLSMVNSLGAGYQCMGVATPSTNPGTPDQNVFYFATQAGTYTNYNAIVLKAGISVLIWDGNWTSQTWFTVDEEPTAGSNNLVKSGGVADFVGLPTICKEQSWENVTTGVRGSFIMKAGITYEATMTREGRTTMSYIKICSGNVSDIGTEYMNMNMDTDIMSVTKSYTPTEDVIANIVIQGTASESYIPYLTLSVKASNNNLLWTKEQSLTSSEKAQVLENLGIVVDDIPTINSNNLVKSGGVASSIKIINRSILNTKYEIDAKIDSIGKNPSVVIKHINPSGYLENSTSCVSFSDMFLALKGSYFYVDAGYKYEYALYNKDTNAFIQRVTWKTYDVVTVLNDDYKIRLEIAKDPEVDISDTTIIEHLHFILYDSKEPINEKVDAIDGRLSTINNVLEKQEDDIVKIKNDIDVNVYNELSSFVFKHINTGGYIVDNDNKNVVNNKPVKCLAGSYFYVDDGYKYQYALYDYNTGVFISRVTWKTDEVTVLDNNYKIRIEISNAEESVLQDMSIVEHLHYKLYAEKRHINKEFINYTQDSVYKAYGELSKQADNLINVIGINQFIKNVMTVHEPDKYSCWPRIGKVGSTLVCLYVKALVHEDPHEGEGAIYATISFNGIIWTPIKLVIDTPSKRDGITGCGNDSNGNLLYLNRVGYPTNGYTFYEVYKTSDGINFEKISTIPNSMPLGHAGDIINVPTKGLMSFFGTYGNERSWGYILSEDNGITWTRVVVETVDKDLCPMEMSAAYLGDGKILVVGRYEEGNTPYMWQMQSSDYGETWTKFATNIAGINNTPSIIYDSVYDKISLYIYNRSTGELEYRIVDASVIWNNPTSWPNAEIIASGAASQDAGNVSTCQFGNNQVAAYYSGSPTDTGIYCVLND